MSKKNTYLHHTKNESGSSLSFNPIKKDNEFTALIDQWVDGKISYDEMKSKYKNENTVNIMKVFTHLFPI